MSLLKRLFGFSKRKKEQKEAVERPESLKDCPFCWGYQEFGSESRTLKVGKFMVEHVDGFKNKKRIIERCPKCGGKKIKYIDNSK